MNKIILTLIAVLTLMLSGLTKANTLSQNSARGLGFWGGILYIFEEKDSDITRRVWENHEMWGGDRDFSYVGIEVIEMYVVERYNQENPHPGTPAEFAEEITRASDLGDLEGEAKLYQAEFQRALSFDLKEFFKEEITLKEAYTSIEKKLNKMKKSYCAVSTAKCESIKLAIDELKSQAKAKFLFYFQTSNQN